MYSEILVLRMYKVCSNWIRKLDNETLDYEEADKVDYCEPLLAYETRCMHDYVEERLVLAPNRYIENIVAIFPDL